jgi:FMN phosphatase YigB (HAD superfamily)
VLVVDIGDVLIDDAFPDLLARIARDSGGDAEVIAARYDALSPRLWRGRVPEQAFWQAMCESCRRPDVPGWRAHLDELLAPRPAIHRLGEWSRQVPIVALSNHRGEWIRPVLDRLDISRHFSALLISSELGCAKPDDEVFDRLLDVVDSPPGRLLFVDDRAENLDAAGHRGIETLWADPDGAWLDDVERRLGGLP